jgi:hypothetical protein
MIDLKARYGSEYQVRLDRPPRVPGLPDAVPPWPQTIPCLRGHIYARPDDTLGAACPSRLDVRDRLAAIPGVTVLQLGRRDIAVTFPPELFPQVAELMQPRKRRRPSPERAARLAEMGTTLRFPDAPGARYAAQGEAIGLVVVSGIDNPAAIAPGASEDAA